MNGKGSSPRPYSVPKGVYDANWEAVFGKRKLLRPKRPVLKRGKKAK